MAFFFWGGWGRVGYGRLSGCQGTEGRGLSEGFFGTGGGGGRRNGFRLLESYGGGMKGKRERERYCGEWVVAVNNFIVMGVIGYVQRYLT